VNQTTILLLLLLLLLLLSHLAKRVFSGQGRSRSLPSSPVAQERVQWLGKK
jgi:hypothetical protein